MTANLRGHLGCKETFSLLYYEFDAATKEPPFWESESYKLIDRIAADDGRFTNNNEVIINTEVRSIPVTKKGVYFALRDQGACISLLSIKVYYMTCPEITVSFAHFPTTPTGAKVTSIEQATGTCIEHARVEREPVYLCTADGQWSLLTGGCVCMPGYQANVETQTCDARHQRLMAGRSDVELVALQLRFLVIPNDSQRLLLLLVK
ncbi:hypothetical protein HAZT_HAZT009973, partial [Hyalella azteca]